MGYAEAAMRPDYCHFVGTACDKTFEDAPASTCFFAYPSHPKTIADALATTAAHLRDSGIDTLTWRGLERQVAGRPIFCEICKAIRMTEFLVADVTTMNFNVMFEIGYAMGMGIPVLPVRDTSYLRDARDFDELGLLDTIGYLDFRNSKELAALLGPRITDATDTQRVPESRPSETPLYVVKPPISPDGVVSMMSTVKKSGIKFRSYDPQEAPRLSLHEAKKQVLGSVGFVSYLLDGNRSGALVHNARAAFIAGLSLSSEQVVCLIQEGTGSAPPIDYRELIRPHDFSSQVPKLLEEPIKALALLTFQKRTEGAGREYPTGLLEILDLGDVAAENESIALNDYFVRTAQYAQAMQGHARLVIGRKGSGKTAIFYATRNAVWGQNSKLVLDLKPEGHQFARLRDFIAEKLPAGLQEHTMVALWTYLLYLEVAHRILQSDKAIARYDPRRMERYERVASAYEMHTPIADIDFSQRLSLLIERILAALNSKSIDEIGARLTELIYLGDMRELRDSVCDYLVDKESVWLLVDNLDKGWPVRGTTTGDILIVRSLLEATRKLQQQLEDHDVEIRCLVFLRSDIFEHLLRDTPDKGKDTAIRLDWNDATMFEAIVRSRVVASTQLSGSFKEDIWPNMCETHVGTEDSFSYIVNRTLMRPRDLLHFLRRAIDVALNRNHQTILAEDLLHAETGYSEDMLLNISYEIQDTRPLYGDLVYAFQGKSHVLDKDEVGTAISEVGVSQSDSEDALSMLLWTGFLGVRSSAFSDDVYSHNIGFNLRRLLNEISAGRARLVVHPMFRAALQTT